MRRRVNRRRHTRRRNPMVLANRHRHHIRRRRRNPGGVLSAIPQDLQAGLVAAGGAMATQTVQQLTAQFVNTGGNMWLDVGVTIGSAVAVGWIADKFGFSKYSRLLVIGGMSLAGGKLIAWAFAQAKGLTGTSGGVAGLGRRRRPVGLRDVVALAPGAWDSYYGSTPVTGGVSDVVSYAPGSTY